MTTDFWLIWGRKKSVKSKVELWMLSMACSCPCQEIIEFGSCFLSVSLSSWWELDGNTKDVRIRLNTYKYISYLDENCRYLITRCKGKEGIWPGNEDLTSVFCSEVLWFLQIPNFLDGSVLASNSWIVIWILVKARHYGCLVGEWFL